MNKGNFSKKVLQVADASLRRLSQGDNLDIILDGLRLQEVGATVADLLFSYFRNKELTDFYIKYCSEKAGSARKKIPAKFQRLIVIAFTQSKYQRGIDEYAAVDLAVGFAKRKYGSRIAGYINALLRRLLIENLEVLAKEAPEHVRLNFPKAVFKRWQQEFGEEKVADFATVFSSKPNLSFRLVGNISEETLKEKKCYEIELPSWAGKYRFFEATEPNLVFAAKWLEKGMIYIQDISTLSPCLFYHPGPNDLVYDLCAAPGGKSLILSERMKSGLLVAADVSLKRQQRTVENLEKSGNKNHSVIISSAIKPALRPETADYVLLDVPCSNTGVCRRRPDVLWNLTDKKLAELVKIQSDIIIKGAELVKQGGTLIYSTCSIEKQENQAQIAALLNQHTEFSLAGERQLFPAPTHDGGYAALLRKK